MMLRWLIVACTVPTLAAAQGVMRDGVEYVYVLSLKDCNLRQEQKRRRRRKKPERPEIGVQDRRKAVHAGYRSLEYREENGARATPSGVRRSAAAKDAARICPRSDATGEVEPWCIPPRG
jgi:hypothetical protein